MKPILLLGLATLKRSFVGFLLLVGASFIIYITIRSAPGDAIDAISPMGTPPELKAKLMVEFGLDRDPFTGFVSWLGRSLSGDFGESLVFAPGETVMEVALPAFMNTISLSALALFLSLMLALILAALMGEPSSRQQLFTGPLYFLTSAPSFVVAVLFAQGMNWFIYNYVEALGFGLPIWYPIPIYTESLVPFLFAGFALMAGDGLFVDLFNGVRADLLGLRRAQFITAVRAKGAKTFPHLARNLMVPLISNYASRLPIILGGVVIVEYIFTLDGAGYVLLEASKVRDFPVVVGLSVLFTAVIILSHLLADLIKAMVDPREVARGG